MSMRSMSRMSCVSASHPYIVCVSVAYCMLPVSAGHAKSVFGGAGALGYRVYV